MTVTGTAYSPGFLGWAEGQPVVSGLGADEAQSSTGTARCTPT
jgi:hypothetical protein